jgi:hypothetical protein
MDLIRGDTCIITFTITTEDNENYLLKEKDKLYFTVKKSFYKTDCTIQKTFNNGITYNERTKEYEVKLDQDCTCNLKCDDYVYDIKLVVDNYGNPISQTLIKGALRLHANATHKVNE